MGVEAHYEPYDGHLNIIKLMDNTELPMTSLRISTYKAPGEFKIITKI